MTKEEAKSKLISLEHYLFLIHHDCGQKEISEIIGFIDSNIPQGNNDELIRAQFVAAAIPVGIDGSWDWDDTEKYSPEFYCAKTSNDIGDAVMAEFIKRREARNVL